MDNAWRARGRARGRTQGTTSTPQQGAPGSSSSQQPRVPAQLITQPTAQPPTPCYPRPASGSSGSGNGGNGNGNGSRGDAPVSRGAIRGRRMLPTEIVHTRPSHMVSKTGIAGRSIDISANYFTLGSVTNWVVNQYRVDFTPDEDHNGLRKALLRQHKTVLGGYVFDGTVLYCCHRFPTDPLELVSTKREAVEPTLINVRFIKQLLHGDAQYLQLFNIIMRKCLHGLQLQLVGRNYFDARASVRIPQFNLELWPGYTTSIRQHESSVMMCAEITHKVMRVETVLDMLKETKQKCHPSEFMGMFKNAVLGLIVLTDYNNRTYRIDDVNFDETPQSTFARRDGTEISYMDYYYQRYQIKIRVPDQPLLVSKSKARELRAGAQETVYLVPELCRMTGLTDQMRDNFHLMRALAEHTRVSPNSRMEKLLAFNKRLQAVPEVVSDLKDWNLSLAPHLVRFKARVLDSENIIQGQEGREIKYQSGQNVDWTNNLRSNPLLSIANLQVWVVMVPMQLKRDADSFMQMVSRAARGMGMMMPKPKMIDIRDDRQATYVNELEQMLSRYNPDVVVCCVSNNRPDRYGAIKKKCCVDRAVPSQVITNKAMTNRGAMSIATKVAIQINCKVGGAPWTVDIPIKGTMIVGVDVSHDTMNKSHSYVAMVASLNNSFSRYYSAVTSNKPSEELSNDLSTNLLKALAKFREANESRLPSRIIIYRDGVGDGQIPHVFSHEVEAVKQTLDKLYGGPDKCRMAFIIVSKKINTRIFFQDRNPPSGTVVDNTITLPERYDFFIVSQSVQQGSVSPTSYNVIADSCGLDADKMQRFTYKLTHLYYNWSGTVKVPAPVQYAHKLAMLVGQNLHRVPHVDLETLLYYL